MKENVSIGKHVDIVMTCVATLWASGLVGPKDFALGVRNGENVFPIGCGNQNQTLSLKKGNANEA
jgi:hypothetical protein